MWTPDLKTTGYKKDHIVKAVDKDELWLSPKLFDTNINKLSVWVWVFVFDIDPAEKQDTYSAVSGKKACLCVCSNSSV